MLFTYQVLGLCERILNSLTVEVCYGYSVAGGELLPDCRVGESIVPVCLPLMVPDMITRWWHMWSGLAIAILMG